MSMITENVAQIRSRIAAAARAAGRDPADIRLCAATKMNDSAAVREAIAAGVDCCGENRVQELVKKLDEHAYDGAPVHFIGALQRNKVRQVVGQVDVIESVDRRELLADINAEAAKRGIPTAVHDSNAVPGLTTKRLAKVADRVMVGYEASRAHYQHPERVVVTGTPVRDDFFKLDRQQARAALGITDDRPLVLSYWGSLGAEGMNQHMTEYLRLAAADGAPFHHIHGAGRDFATMTKALDGEALPKDLEIREYIYDMPTVMQAADLVLCRGGASTLSELTAIGKPAVIVPSPYVTNNHQEKNANVLAQAGGAVVLLEPVCSGALLYKTTKELLADAPRRERMAKAMADMGIPDAAEKIYETLAELAKGE